jgi:hypothetical protein
MQCNVESKINDVGSVKCKISWPSPSTHVQAKEWANESLREETGQLSSCAAGYVAVKPRKGDAILWHNVHSDGTLDTDSLHLGYSSPLSAVYHDSMSASPHPLW